MFFESTVHKVKIMTAEKSQSLTDTEINRALDELRMTKCCIDKINYIRSNDGKLITCIIEYLM